MEPYRSRKDSVYSRNWLAGAMGSVRGGRRNYGQVQGLLDLAEQLNVLLVPVTPRGGFRGRLHDDLVRQARNWESKPQPKPFQQHRKGILVGAAAIGSLASVAGVIIAFVLRHRHSRASHAASG